jgi:flagellar hook-length control protein FliK
LPGDGTAQGVSTAQLADAATHTEMRIAMQTDKLGNIELRAHVSGETVAAAITVEKRDAHSILAGELPALQQALSEKSLRVDQVALFQGSLDLNHSQAGKDAEQQQAHSAQQQTKAWTMQSSNSSILSSEHLQTGSFDSTGRLNVQA